MPTFEIITSEVILTTLHVAGESEEEAIENFHANKGTVVSQKITTPDLELIELVSQ